MTNTPSFAVPDGGLGSATFGRITSTGNNIPRQFQFAGQVPLLNGARDSGLGSRDYRAIARPRTLVFRPGNW